MTQRSGHGGKRRSRGADAVFAHKGYVTSVMQQSCKRLSNRREAETEQSGLCDDDMQEQGVTRLLTINLNDVEKELNIR